jgi:hypothetical protein
VKGIAEAGKGAAEFITTGERMQAKVKQLFRKKCPTLAHYMTTLGAFGK